MRRSPRGEKGVPEDFVAHTQPDTPERLTWRMGLVETRLKEHKMEFEQRVSAVEKEIEAMDVKGLRYQMQDLGKDLVGHGKNVASMRRAFYFAAATFFSATIGFIFNFWR